MIAQKIGILNSGGYNINSIRFALERLDANDIVIVENEDELYGFINALSIEQLQKMLENIHTMQSQLDKR